MPSKVYLAGPEVFLPNAREMLARKAELARAAGLIPLSPGDLEIPPADTKKGFGCSISAVDERLMLEADAIIGFMCALGKAVFAYTNVAANHYRRVLAHYHGDVEMAEDGHLRGPDGLSVENFDMVDNLMLHGGIERRGGTVVVGHAAPDALYTDLAAFEACLAIAAERLG